MPNQRFSILTAGLCLIGLLQAPPVWAADDEGKRDASDTTLLATINGQAMPLDLFRVFYYERMREEQTQNDPAFQERAFNEFINLVVLAQEAQRRDLGERPDVRNAIELQKLELMAKVAQQALVQETPVTDAEVKKAYDQFLAEAERTEYKARHILVKDEAEAKKLIAQLDKGANFAELAKKHSLGPTAKNGGDLDWFTSGQMVKPFADAVQQLKPKSYTKKPVQTQFGWHVILLEETRKATPPSFDEAKPQLTMALQRERLAGAVTALREKATVSLNTDVVKLKDENAKK